MVAALIAIGLGSILIAMIYQGYQNVYQSRRAIGTNDTAARTLDGIAKVAWRELKAWSAGGCADVAALAERFGSCAAGSGFLDIGSYAQVCHSTAPAAPSAFTAAAGRCGSPHSPAATAPGNYYFCLELKPAARVGVASFIQVARRPFVEVFVSLRPASTIDDPSTTLSCNQFNTSPRGAAVGVISASLYWEVDQVGSGASAGLAKQRGVVIYAPK